MINLPLRAQRGNLLSFGTRLEEIAALRSQ